MKNEKTEDLRESGLNFTSCGLLAQGQPVSETRKGEVMVQVDHHTARLDYYKIILKTM
jgi:hypothetical protein